MECEIARANQHLRAARYLGIADGPTNIWRFPERHTDRQLFDFSMPQNISQRSPKHPIRTTTPRASGRTGSMRIARSSNTTPARSKRSLARPPACRVGAPSGRRCEMTSSARGPTSPTIATRWTIPPSGLNDIERIVAQSVERLYTGGWLLLEHGYDQGATCRELVIDAGMRDEFTLTDIAGLPRLTGAQWRGNS